jgi:hypothetical protein
MADQAVGERGTAYAWDPVVTANPSLGVPLKTSPMNNSLGQDDD